jgi:hypothetical protein
MIPGWAGLMLDFDCPEARASDTVTMPLTRSLP